METAAKILSVAIGGAFGAVARYLINISPLAGLFGKFPFPTFFINITGSFLIGFLLVLLTDKFSVSDNLRLAVIVGFLGAFTTFSTFEMEIYELSRGKEFFAAFVYLFLSVAFGFVGVALGVWLARRF
ncbi:MAG: fluoride efflux transporter CrcB [Acidobacteriota bacterium]|nr:fluoride efflux transporter CrcB [Acidobacteriota bacterium]